MGVCIGSRLGGQKTQSFDTFSVKCSVFKNCSHPNSLHLVEPQPARSACNGLGCIGLINQLNPVQTVVYTIHRFGL